MVIDRQTSKCDDPTFSDSDRTPNIHLIQELPNADRLRDYVWQHPIEGGGHTLGGRHTAVIPALPEDPNDGYVDDTMTTPYPHPLSPSPSHPFTTI